MSTASAGVSPSFTDIVVVVHGIGSQLRYSTVRSVATRFAVSKSMTKGCEHPPVAPQPLGYFHSDVRDLTSVRLVDDEAVLQGAGLAGIGVAEVFWADIPERADQEGNTLEETKAWARTVVARAQALYVRAKTKGERALVPPDFHLAAEVLEEIIDTVYVMENLSFIAEKAGVFKFDLRETLEDYLGDVQIVAEFREYRTEIVGRFRKAMNDIFEHHVKMNPQVRLHIVAHSEGTVVSFLGLLEALSGQWTKEFGVEGEIVSGSEGRGQQIPEWVKHVHGYMTIGSPIDKHLLLWPRLWENFEPSFANSTLPAGQIRWRNYYDFGDPVGFKLDTAREWLDQKKADVFQFCGCPKCRHDIGFARYLFPGKAHNDYWEDADVFEHFIGNVVRREATPVPPPATKRDIAWVSPTFPYLLSFLILNAGVFVLYKTVTEFVHPERAPLEEIFLVQQLGLSSERGISGFQLLQHTLGISMLIAGTTAFARLPRLAAGLDWIVAGFGMFLIGCAAYVGVVAETSRQDIGAMFDVTWLSPNGPTLGLLALAFVVGLGALLLARTGKTRGEERRQWILRRGMRPLLLSGAIAISAIVGSQLFPGLFGSRISLADDEVKILTPAQVEVIRDARLTRAQVDQLLVPDENRSRRLATLGQVESLLTNPPPVWPVVLATAAFLYLWWLGALIFDLAFVWQRYVRAGASNARLREWSHAGGHHPRASRGRGAEKCRNAEALASRGHSPSS